MMTVTTGTFVAHITVGTQGTRTRTDTSLEDLLNECYWDAYFQRPFSWQGAEKIKAHNALLGALHVMASMDENTFTTMTVCNHHGMQFTVYYQATPHSVAPTTVKCETCGAS
jgi:hypothetical protein